MLLVCHGMCITVLVSLADMQRCCMQGKAAKSFLSLGKKKSVKSTYKRGDSGGEEANYIGSK
jgi:hypothetical protein